MQNYNYAEEIIKDYDNLNAQKIDEQDILQNIFNTYSGNYTSAENKINGLMEALKTVTIIHSLKVNK